MTDAQIDDFFEMLDRDGDGEIDYQEFARWFGTGPPPAPMLPQAQRQMEAQEAAKAADSGSDRSAFLASIAAAAKGRKGRMAPPPPPPPDMKLREEALTASGGNSTEHLDAIRRVAMEKAEKRSWPLMLQLKRDLALLSPVFTWESCSPCGLSAVQKRRDTARLP